MPETAQCRAALELEIIEVSPDVGPRRPEAVALTWGYGAVDQ